MHSIKIIKHDKKRGWKVRSLKKGETVNRNRSRNDRMSRASEIALTHKHAEMHKDLMTTEHNGRENF